MHVTGASDDMAGWHLRDKLGLNGTRLELVDTAAGVQLGFDEVQTQATRLFKSVHLNGRGADRPPFEGPFRPSCCDDIRSAASRSGKGSSWRSSASSALAGS